MDELILADVNRWVGVAIALVGAFVVAPDGTRLLVASSWSWLRRQGNSARAKLTQLLPFLRRETTIHAHSAIHASATGAITVTASASGRGWRPTAPVDERIEALRQHITDVEASINRTAEALRQETADRKQADADHERTLRADVAELRRLLDERDRTTAQVDARGLPVIGIGILLSGVPETLAAIPGHVGWLFPALGAFLAAAALAHWWRTRRRSHPCA